MDSIIIEGRIEMFSQLAYLSVNKIEAKQKKI